VTIRIYDFSGRLVRSLDLGHRPAGHYITSSKAAYWDGTNQLGERVASGVYFYTLKADRFTATRKLFILK
jgi:flagellar hook assembly protein FlgD